MKIKFDAVPTIFKRKASVMIHFLPKSTVFSYKGMLGRLGHTCNDNLILLTLHSIQAYITMKMPIKVRHKPKLEIRDSQCLFQNTRKVAMLFENCLTILLMVNLKVSLINSISMCSFSSQNMWMSC